MKNFFITVLLFLLAGSSASANSGNFVGIAPYCEGNVSWYNKSFPVSPIKIEVKFMKPKKWYINAQNILLSNTELVWEKYKKSFQVLFMSILEMTKNAFFQRIYDKVVIGKTISF